MFARILCGSDFSEPSRRALQIADRLRATFGGSLSVIHVGDPLLVQAAAASRSVADVQAETERDLRAFVEETLGAAGASVTTLVAVGNAAAEIIDSARTSGADLIVVATHGRGGFERLMLGSVTEKVLRKAACPVLTVPPTMLETSQVAFSTILCPVDFSASSAQALATAAAVAEVSQARLLALHVVEGFGDEATDWCPCDDCTRRFQERAAEKLRALVPAETRERGRVEEKLATGRPYVEILRVAGEETADLIVMGVQGRSAIDLLLLGSTTHHVVRSAVCPVLTVRT